ncbi:Ig-like domain-containing protein [Antarctobacter jejuensis]|uniref:Ig-like domain-containing protein n=1 Tax=Antarctobacter jejuensis TaxID=1439938 RepID=UPI003FD10A42
MNAIKFVTRTRAGDIQRGAVDGDKQGFLIDASGGQDVSVNISRADVRGYDRAANDLLITLADGRVIVLEGYYDLSGDEIGSRLFLSANGELNEVTFVQSEGGALFAQYGPTESWGKWSPSDQLIFLDEPTVVAEVEAIGAADGNEVSMLAAGLLGMGGLGAAGLGAAALGGAALIGAGTGGGGSGGGGGAQWVGPTVDDPDGSYEINGGDDPSIAISGTANPGSTVDVTIGDTTLTGTAGDDRTWRIVFEGDDFPPDGLYENIGVSVVDPNGTVTDLAGPTFEIDTTPPLIDIEDGTVSTGVLVNAEDHADGVTVTGKGEPGAEMKIIVGDASQVTTVGEDGTWSFTFSGDVFPGGTYEKEITLVSTDLFGNSTTVVDVVQVDTENAVTLENAPLTGDNLVSGGEYDSGLVLTGTGEAGATITVTVEGVTKTATVDADGGWSVTFDKGDLPTGTYDTTAEIVSTDLAGNAVSMTHSFSVDTEMTLTVNTATVEGDGVINAAEAADGTVLTGTAEPGATVSLMANGVDYDTTADGSGQWSVMIPPENLPRGTVLMDVAVTATDAAGNTVTATGSVDIDTELALTIDTSALAVDGVINSTEHAGMVTFTGTGEPGTTVTLELYGEQASAVVNADGSWSMPFPASVLPTNAGQADAIMVEATVFSTDAAGNMALASGGFQIDVTNHVEMYLSGVEGDGTVNAAERADGVVLTGYTEATDAGSSVTVTVNGNSYDATVAADGSWQVLLPASEIPEGETTLDVMATSIDGVGNVATTSGSIDIDTLTDVTVNTAGVEGDGVVNAAERADGVTLTGTAEPGSTVSVSLGTVTHPATVAADGSWTVDFSAAELPTGEKTLNVVATSTDPAGNSDTATGTVDLDTLVRNFAITSTPGGADGVINASEAAQGLSLTGTTEPGGTVAITLNGHTVQAVVDAGGNWTADFTAAQLPSGEQTVTLTAVSKDMAGNTDTITQNVIIDTDAGLLTISPEPVEIDDVVNFVEASDGVTIKGTSTPGQIVDVTMNGVTHSVLTDASGNWSVDYAPGEIAPGTYTADISATIVDSAGNTLTRTDSVQVDTEVVNFAPSGTPVEGDNVINATEASDGFTLTGTTEPGGTVSVTFEGVTHAATVDAAGNWSVDFTAAEIPSGEMNSGARIDTTDVAGNVATTSVAFDIDTLVNTLALSSDPVTPDGVINAAEAAQGVTLNGTVEVGSTVIVTVGGMAHVATVDASGNWTVDIPPAAIPTGTLSAPVEIEAVDPAGNSRTITESLSIDTEQPDTISWTGYGRDGSGVDLIRTEISGDEVFLGKLDSPQGTPSVVEVNIDSSTDIPAIGQTYMDLAGSVPDGTHLVLASTDAAGNSSGAYLVTDDPATNAVQMSDDIAAALSDFQIETIDLHFAEDSSLTITEAQIKALSDHTDTVTIRGGADDQVTITGAQAQGTRTVDGEGFNVFSLGDATLLIEDDITSVHGVT